MKILLVHNYYKQRGGEDESFEAEAKLLKANGHEVQLYTRHNDEIDEMAKLKVAADMFWNRRTIRELSKVLSGFQADVIHCTNLFPIISASAYKAAKLFSVPVVQSLRNYRHLCLNSFLYREGAICEQCRTKSLPIAGITNSCYRNSTVGSGLLAAHNYIHNRRKTVVNGVDLFFTPSQFAREKYVQSGWPAEKIRVKPNFLADVPERENYDREFALFVGRLSEEKGVKTLIESWVEHQIPLPLKVVGDGFLSAYVEAQARDHKNIYSEGRLELQQVQSLMARSKFLVMPSQWYETFGRTMMEAFASGTPVIASDLGAMSELVDDETNGLTFEQQNKSDLAKAVSRLISSESLRVQLGKQARISFENKYTAEINHDHLMRIYREAIALHSAEKTKLPGME